MTEEANGASRDPVKKGTQCMSGAMEDNLEVFKTWE